MSAVREDQRAAGRCADIDGFAVNTHIVFLTDGILDVDDADGSNDLYSAHGLERYEDRTKGSGTNLEAHRARFLAACARTREMGITIWVIALDTGDTADTVSPEYGLAIVEETTEIGHQILS